MAADRSRLAAALAYKQAEEERRRRMLESIPTPAGTTPAQPAPQADFRTNLENLSIGVGEGLTNQLEGIKGVVTDPVGTAKGVYEAGKAVVRDPAIIASALRQMGQKAMSGPLGAGEVIGEMLGPRKTGPVMAELDVYHGTPHRFPATEANPLGEFDASKIGTGEGAQAYGHGIYYAESPTVAKNYATAGVKDEEGAAAHYLKIYKDPERAAQSILEEHPKDRVTERSRLFAEKTAEILRSGKTPTGNLYKADLPDEMVDRMLDWDKPLSEQRELATPILKELGYLRPTDDGPRQFSQAVKALALEHGGFGESGATGMALFNAIYKGLQQGKPRAINLAKRMNLNEQEMFMEASPLASEVMKRMGIPGIKYADAGSRGQGGSGTRNFVVFPGEEKKVRILERDGQKAPPQKIAQALEAIKPVKAQAKAGGEIAESNGYFYKGGQFLPSTEAEPGRWKIGKKVVTTKQEVIAPGEMAVQPTPFSRSIYQAALGQGDWVTKTPEGLKVRENIKTSTGEPITPDMKIRLGVKGVLGKEELTLQEFVDAYNKGQRWFDVQPDARVVRSK